VNVTVYAITNSRAVPHIPGLRAVRAGPLTALVASARRAPAPSPANLRRYHKTIAAIADTVPAVLPARYGTLTTEPELEMVLHSRVQSLITALRRVHGRVQMTLRLTGVASPAEPLKTSSGRAYLRALAGRERDIPGFDAVRAELRSWIDEERVERRGDVVSVYHLVPRRSSAAYARTAARSIAGAGLRGVVSGPFPPYAFSVW
jgi:hypothetical protein